MKSRIIKNRPQLSSEEIASKQNFTILIKRYQIWKKRRSMKLITLGSSILIIALAVLLLFDESDTQTLSSIKPPFKNIAIPYTCYQIDAKTGGNICCQSGTTLSIPSNAFVDSLGHAIGGLVQVSYREFRNTTEILLSGIPMSYDTASQVQQFESAGMFQIEASQNGTKLFLKKDTPVSVEFQSDYRDADYSIYNLDTATGKWSYQGGNAISERPKTNQATKILSAVAIQKQTIAPKSIIDEPLKPIQATSTMHCFQIAVDTADFPELAQFTEFMFAVNEQYTKFNKMDEKIMWDDIEIKKTQTKGEYRIILTKNNRVKEYIAHPVFFGENYNKAMKQYEQAFSAYSVKRKKRDEERALLMQKEKARIEEQNSLQAEQLARQKALNELYYSNAVIRSFKIQSLGIWNIDRFSLLNNTELYTIRLDIDSTFTPQALYWVMKDKNSVISLKTNLNIVIKQCLISQQNAIIGITSQNTAFVLTDSMIKQTPMENNMKHLKPLCLKTPIRTIEQATALINGSLSNNKTIPLPADKLEITIESHTAPRFFILQTPFKQQYNVLVKNIKGIVVKSYLFNDIVYRMDLTGLPSGNYQLEVTAIDSKQKAVSQISKQSDHEI